MTINIICETAPGFSFHYKKLAQTVIEQSLDSEGFPYEAEVNLTLVDEKRIHENKGRVVGFVELPFHIRESRSQIIRVLRVESRTEAMEAVPVDVDLGSFRVDVFTVGKVETSVIVLGVIGAVGPGSSVVSC